MIRIEGNRTALYQWDSNQRIILNDIFARTQVHFTDEHSAESESLVVMSYQENGQIFANVPNILLQNSGTIDVYIYVEKEDKAFEYTKKNAEKFNLKNVNLVKCDIFDFDFSLLPLADAIISNPH